MTHLVTILVARWRSLRHTMALLPPKHTVHVLGRGRARGALHTQRQQSRRAEAPPPAQTLHHSVEQFPLLKAKFKTAPFLKKPWRHVTTLAKLQQKATRVSR